MKGFKVLSSGMILLSLIVWVSKANAEKLPNTRFQTKTEKFPVELTPSFTQFHGDHNNVKAYLDQGFKLLDKEDYRGAIEAFNQAISLSPNNPYSYLGRGLGYFSLKQYQEAKRNFDQSINLNPNIGYAYLFRGMSNYALGNKQNALDDLQIAANLFQKAGETEMARKSLDAIKRIRNA